MNRTLQALIVLGLSLVLLGVAWRGAGLRHEAEPAREASQDLQQAAAQDLQQAAAQKAASMEKAAAEERERSSRRLALTYRLKKISGKRAQAEASGAAADVLSALDEQIRDLENELRHLSQNSTEAVR